MKEKIEFGN
jgi:WD40 repeat protein